MNLTKQKLNHQPQKPTTFKKTHSSKGREVEFTAEQMEQHLLEIIILNMKQVFEVRDVNEIPDPVVENEPVFKVASQEQISEIVANKKKQYKMR